MCSHFVARGHTANACKRSARFYCDRGRSSNFLRTEIEFDQGADWSWSDQCVLVIVWDRSNSIWSYISILVAIFTTDYSHVHSKTENQIPKRFVSETDCKKIRNWPSRIVALLLGKLAFRLGIWLANSESGQFTAGTWARPDMSTSAF